MEQQEIASVSASSCDKQHSSQEDDDVDTLFVIGRHRWDVDCWFLHEDPIMACTMKA